MKPRVLFLCTGNSARSQMAEGYLRHVAGDDYEAVSGGTAPAGLNPLAVEAMREIGIDISQQRSKDVAQFLGVNIAFVVTVCDRAKESCPVFHVMRLPNTLASNSSKSHRSVGTTSRYPRPLGHNRGAKIPAANVLQS